MNSTSPPLSFPCHYVTKWVSATQDVSVYSSGVPYTVEPRAYRLNPAWGIRHQSWLQSPPTGIEKHRVYSTMVARSTLLGAIGQGSRSPPDQSGTPGCLQAPRPDESVESCSEPHPDSCLRAPLCISPPLGTASPEQPSALTLSICICFATVYSP